MKTQTAVVAVSGILISVIKKALPGGQSTGFTFRIEDTAGLATFFTLSFKKSMLIANSKQEWPLGATLKVHGRLSKGAPTKNRLNYARIVSVNGVEMLAWAHKMVSGMPQHELEAVVSSRAHANRALLIDPKNAYTGAMAIVRRQNKLKNPRLEPKELWYLRDALNLLAQKLDIL